MREIEWYGGKDLAYPKQPVKPRATQPQTSNSAMQYAQELKIYEDAMAAYIIEKDAYTAEKHKRHDAFITDLFKEFGVTDNPKADKCFNMAWDHGHSSGYSEVCNVFSELVELIN